MHLQFGPMVMVGHDGYLGILFTKTVKNDRTRELDTQVTFIFQFVPDEKCYFTEHLEQEAKKGFTDVSVTHPVLKKGAEESYLTYTTNLVFTQVIRGPLHNPEGFLQAMKNKLQTCIRTAWDKTHDDQQRDYEWEEDFHPRPV